MRFDNWITWWYLIHCVAWFGREEGDLSDLDSIKYRYEYVNVFTMLWAIQCRFSFVWETQLCGLIYKYYLLISSHIIPRSTLVNLIEKSKFYCTVNVTPLSIVPVWPYKRISGIGALLLSCSIWTLSLSSFHIRKLRIFYWNGNAKRIGRKHENTKRLMPFHDMFTVCLWSYVLWSIRIHFYIEHYL